MYLCEGKLFYAGASGTSNLTVTVTYLEPDDATHDDKMQDLLNLASNVQFTNYSLRELTLVSQKRFKKGETPCLPVEPACSSQTQVRMTLQFSPISTHNHH